MIRVEALSARAGTFVLSDISLDVPARGWCAVVGAAGAGKTTLLECIAGLQRSTGRIVLNDRDVSQSPAEDRGASLVYQHGYLFPHLTVGENVAYGAPSDADARTIGDRFGLFDLWHRDAGTLSGGERQLVAIARALARPARAWLLDEPFSSLDFVQRPRVRALVRELSVEREATVLFVTHDLVEAGIMTSHAVHIAGGRVAATGPSHDLLPVLSGDS